MVAIKIRIPEVQTIGIFEGDEKYKPRLMWVYNKRKNREAPFICRYRVIHPLSISRIMCITLLNAISVCGI